MPGFDSSIRHMKSSAVFSILIAILASALLTVTGFAAQPLVELRACKFIPTEWADGDSFEIQTADGTRHTLRIYGADCIEWHVTDETDARRLREQRRYFGIAEFGGSAQTSIDAAKATGKSAAEETARVLARPFTVHTAFADAKGDGKHKRIYGFVTTAAEEDLAERLVRLGLARAFGVYRETPDGKSAKDYQEYLRDVELVAAKESAGVWAKTNWNLLSSERQEQRKEDTELGMATGAAKSSKVFKINPNTAARDELMRVPGIGEVTANRIIGGRPYKKASDLLNVEGIGPKTMERLAPYLLLPDKK
jgi:competence protein ComEA